MPLHNANKKNMKKPLITVLSGQILLLLLTCGLAAAASQPELQKIRHTVLSPTAEQVALQFNGSYSPKIFTLKDETPRIIFDFPEMTHTREIQATTTTKGSLVKRIRVGKHTGETQKTRIVFDMATLTGVTYTQKFDEKSSSLVVEFTSAKPAAALSKSTPAAATEAGPSKAKGTVKKVDEKKVLAAEPAQVPPESPEEAKPTAKTETTPPVSPAESSPATSKETSPQPVVPAEKTEEKKTPTATTAPSQPEATAAAKTETTQSDSTATVAPPETSPKQTITVVKAEEKTLPTPAPAQPDTAAKTPAKTEPAQAETTVIAPPAPPVPSSKPAETVPKPEEKVGPPPAPTQPETVAKPPVKAEPAQAEITASAPPATPVPSPKPAETVAKPEEKVGPSPETVAKTPAKTEQPQAETTVIAPPAPPAPSPKPAETVAKPEEKVVPTPAPAKTEAAKPAAIAGGAGGALLESVRFDGTSSKGEMILFKLNDFHPPVIHGVEEGVPRVICDFNGMQLADSVKNLIKADGKHVKIIRVTKSKKPDRVRVVLDLAPNRSYDLQQVFFKEDNLFVIIVNTTKK